MRKSFLLIFFLIAVLFSSAQSNDPALNKRLLEYLAANKELNFEKIMEYIHPKLFEIVPKEMMIQAMKQTFENDQLKVSLDSMDIISVGIPLIMNRSAIEKLTTRWSLISGLRILQTPSILLL